MPRFLLLIGILIGLFLGDIRAQTSQVITNGQPTAPVSFPGTTCIYTWSNNNPAIGLPASGTGNINSFTATNTGSTPIKGTITAMPLSGGYAYIVGLSGNSVSVVNTSNNQLVSTIGVGYNPAGVSVSADGSRVYIANAGDNSVSVINTLSNSVVATIAVGLAPQGIVVTPDGGKVYVVNSDGTANSVSVINTTTNTVIKTIPVGFNPRGIAVSPDGSRVYVSNNTSSSVSIINTSNNTVLTTVPVGQNPCGVAVSPDGKFIYTANQTSNNVTFIDAATNQVVKSVAAAAGAFGIVVSTDGKFIYTANLNASSVSVINTVTGAVTPINVGNNPEGISISDDGSLVYVTCAFPGSLNVISTSTNKVISTLSLDVTPESFGNFIKTGNNCGNTPITFDITVNPTGAPLAIIASAASGSISACAGSASASPNIQQFTVSGSNLAGTIIATASTGFQVSLAPGSGYGSSVTLNQSGSTVANTVVYVRSASTAATGNITGNVILTSTGATNKNVAVSGVINSAFTVNPVSDQSLANGETTQAVKFTGTAKTVSWVNNTPGIGLAANGLGDIDPFKAINLGNTPVTATITATPVAAGFAYVTNEDDNNVSVINTVTDAVVATIPVGTQPRASAVSPDGTKVYITNIGSGSISVINTTTNTVIATIGVGSAPQGIIVSPDGSRVYVSNANSDTISIINAVSNTVVSTVNVGTYPEGLCLSPDGALLYVGNSDDQNVSVIKTSDNSLVTKITSGIFFNVTDVLVSRDGKSLYVTNGGTLSVINTVTYGLIKNIAVGSAIEGIALTPDGGKLFVANSGSNNVTVINTATNDITTTVRVDMQPESVSVSPDGSTLYVTNYGSNTVSVINAVTNVKITTVTVGSHPVSFGSFVTGSLGCAGAPITFKITVTPPTGANIRASAAVGTISACAGQPAASPNIQQILVSANNLSADIAAMAPTGFEISLTAGIGYANSLTLAQSGGVVDNVVVYVRSAASAPAGNIAGNVVLSSPGAATQNIPVAGAINALPSLQPINNQVHANGEATDPVSFISTANNITWVNDTPTIGLAASGVGNIASFTATNTTANPVKATITATPGPVVPGYAYIANQNDGTVSVIDVTSNTVVSTIKVGSHPSRVSVSPDNSRVYVGNYGSNSVSVINTATNSVVSTLNAGTQPFGVSVSPDGGLLYVTNENTANVSVINTASNSIVATVGVGSYPYSVLVNPDGSKAYVINNGSNSVSVINTANNQVVATIKVGVSPIGVAVSPDGNRLYVANSNLGSTSSVSVINTVNNTVIATIPVGLNAYGIAVSPDGSRLYVTNNGSNTISVINTGTSSLITTIPALHGAAPTGVSVSPDGSQAYVVNYLLNNVSVISTATNTITANVSVGSGPLSFGNFVTAATGCPGTPVTFTITVNPGINAAAITGTGTLTALNTVYGTPSPAENFTVAGANLTAGISVTPPAGFEVSTDNIGFNKTISIGTAGTVAAIKVYIRLSATTPVGTYSGDIVLASAEAANVNIAMPNSTVTPAALTITADNKTKFYQNANPELTATYNGFVNNETSAVLTALPLITTTATLNSAAGEYPITVGGAMAANYSTSYVAGILTINPVLQTKDIPNVFTPNGDGVNDSWNINGLGTYINCTVDVFTRYGQKVFSSVGYGVPWDGRSKNTNVPAGTYYYMINLNDGSKVLSGYVAIIR